MNQKQKQAVQVGVNLDADTQGGYTTDISTKRSDKVCPRCMQKRVNKMNRRCDACKGRLLWGFDDAGPFDRTFIHYFRWHTFNNGFTGWVDASFFKDGIEMLKY